MYGVLKDDKIMKIIVISVRKDNIVYKLAEKRINF